MPPGRPGAARRKPNRFAVSRLTMADAQQLSTPAKGEGVSRAIVTGQVVSLNDASAADGTWVAGHLQSDDGSTRIPFTGSDLPGCQVGCTVRLVGQWERHADFGVQFRADEVQTALPTNRAAVVRYIKANVRNCGVARAALIYDALGPDCLTTIAGDPNVLRGIFTGKTADQQVAEWREWADGYTDQRRAIDLLLRLMGTADRVTYKLALRIQRHFKRAGDTEDVVLRHPYRLVEVPGIGFKRADEVARGMGVAIADPTRVAAGLTYTLEQAMGKGHSALPRAALERRAVDALAVDDAAPDAAAVASGIDRALAAGSLVCDGDVEPLIYLPRVLATERFVAHRLAEFRRRSRGLTPAQRATVEGVLAPIRAAERISPPQEAAVWMALENGVSILTGRPGSGKTTTTRAFVAAAEALGWTLQLAAPTGKAAARAAEVTGLDAKTIHRLIGGAMGQTRDEPIDARVVILDESSMCDLDVAAWLLRNIDPQRTALLFVGDNDQLPSVGHGRVLGDMIDSGTLPTVALTEIFRQGEGSHIIENAHRLLDGHPLLLDNSPGTDFLFADVTADDVLGEDGFPIQDDPERPAREKADALRRLTKALRFLVRRKGALPVRDIQVLSPMTKDLLGVEHLNAVLQAELNPNGTPGPLIAGGVRVRVGDRVIQCENDYTVPEGLFNGEQGEVLAVAEGCGAEEGAVVVRFDDRTLTLTGRQLYKLRLAWAITVHRSQGSEYPFVVMFYHSSHHVMLEPALLYTGMTRARRLFLLIGNHYAVKATVNKVRSGRAAVRYTALARRVAAACAAAEPGDSPAVGPEPPFAFPADAQADASDLAGAPPSADAADGRLPTAPTASA